MNIFSKADSGNLPEVNMPMILEYFQTCDKHNIAEIRGVKSLMSSRISYIDSAVGYVEVKRENIICTVRAKVVPEHKITKKHYVVRVQCNEQENNIIDTECEGCPASEGGCKHTLVLLFWLEKRTSEPASTSNECYWKKPRLSNEAMQPVTSKNIFKSKKSAYTLETKDPTKLDSFYTECTKNNTLDSLITSFMPTYDKGLGKYCIFDLVLDFVLKTNDHSFTNFKNTMFNCLTDDVIAQIESSTKDQANSKLWHSIRQARITGSKIYEACHCQTPDGSLVQQILGGYKFYETTAMKRGKKLEKDVRKEIENKMKVNISECGFKLINLLCGASPDGVTKDFIVEIKCPSSKKAFKTYVHTDKIQPKFYAQCQLQMLAMGYKKCAFSVADPEFEKTKKVDIFWVDFDSNYAKNLLVEGEIFWEKNIYPKVLESANL